MISDEQYRYLSEAGFTKALALYEGRNGGSEMQDMNDKANIDALQALAHAETYGIEYYVLHSYFYNFFRQEEAKTYDEATYRALMESIFSGKNPYLDHPAFAGNFAADEPNFTEIERVYYQVLIYNEMMQKYADNGGEAFVNLLPYEGVNASVRVKYEAYLTYYFEYIAPLLGYVSYDHYPLNYSGEGDTWQNEVSETHLLNLELMAQLCKKHGVELRTFIWARTNDSSSGHRAVQNANDLRFQIYSNMAFGSKEMTYFMYCDYYVKGTGSSTTLIDSQTGERTQLYYWAQEANNEVHAMEDAFLNFTWDSVTVYDTGATCKQLSLLEKDVALKDAISSVSSNADLLIGNFISKDGEDGFLVMNYTDPYGVEEAQTVALTFNGAAKAAVYFGGEKKVVELVNGVCTLTLEAGAGAFIVPLA